MSFVATTPVRSPATPAGPRPSGVRRAALLGAGFLACAVPAVFAVNLSRMLLLGELPGHRLHQLTGQGLLLVALWLAGLVPQLQAGWAGRAPRPSAVLLQLGFVVSGVLCTMAAPLGGAPFLLGYIVVTGLLVQLALPVREWLRNLSVRVAPAGLTASLVLAAVAAPYVVAQLELQHAATGHHATNPHYFDMAWLVASFAALALVAAVVVQARSLLLWAGGGVLLTGTAMVALQAGVGTGAAFIATGLALVAAHALERRRAPQEELVAAPSRG